MSAGTGGRSSRGASPRGRPNNENNNNIYNNINNSNIINDNNNR